MLHLPTQNNTKPIHRWIQIIQLVIRQKVHRQVIQHSQGIQRSQGIHHSSLNPDIRHNSLSLDIHRHSTHLSRWHHHHSSRVSRLLWFSSNQWQQEIAPYAGLEWSVRISHAVAYVWQSSAFHWGSSAVSWWKSVAARAAVIASSRPAALFTAQQFKLYYVDVVLSDTYYRYALCICLWRRYLCLSCLNHVTLVHLHTAFDIHGTERN